MKYKNKKEVVKNLKVGFEIHLDEYTAYDVAISGLLTKEDLIKVYEIIQKILDDKK